MMMKKRQVAKASRRGSYGARHARSRSRIEAFVFALAGFEETQILDLSFGFEEAQILSATLGCGFLFAYTEFKETRVLAKTPRLKTALVITTRI
jgi:hypothetical protein